MGKRQKKGVKGEASAFISRTRAVRKLQVSLADFRRLCILKGIYPREPKDKKRVNKGSTAPRTFYSTKDIAFLAHEPLLQKFREFKVFARKLRKALAKRQVSIAESLRENKPVLTLDHLIKERYASPPPAPFDRVFMWSLFFSYPTFVDALHDLDDALCMMVLFSRMPKVGQIAPAFLASCSRLCAEFLNYIVVTHSLRKVFLSIKGARRLALLLARLTGRRLPRHLLPGRHLRPAHHVDRAVLVHAAGAARGRLSRHAHIP